MAAVVFWRSVSLNAQEIAAVAAELVPLIGARVENVRVFAERGAVFEFRTSKGDVELLVTAEADLTRIHAVRRRPPAPETPFPFQAVLRRELESSRLAALQVIPGDRVVELRFERAAQTWFVVAELTGRHGNLFLLDGERIVRAAAGRNLSSRRKLVAGQAYEPPAPRPISAEAGAGEAIRFEPIAGEPFSLSAAIEQAYASLERERRLLEERRRLREPVRAAVARLRRAQEKLVEEAARVPAAEADRRAADLLKVNLHQLRRGVRKATLIEYTEEGPREVEVALDPTLGPRENMERAYRRYRRIVESAVRVEARAQQVREQLDGLLRVAALVEGAALEDLPRLEREARRLGVRPRRPTPVRRKKEHAEQALPYRLFKALGGGAILVGRGAAQNDALTLRIARGNDMWLHVRGRTGAHVVIRLEKGKGPDQDALLDAAHLAVHFSEARGEPSTEIAYTRAKYVRKSRGAAPGAVTYSQERTLLLRMEPLRLERLLASEEAADE